MIKILKLIKREIMTKVLTRGFVIGTLLGPILISGFYYIPALLQSYSQNASTLLQIVDYSGLVMPQTDQLFADTLSNGQQQFVVIPLTPDAYEANREAPQRAVEDGAIGILLIIPGDFLSGGEVTYMAASVTNVGNIQQIRSRLQQAANLSRLNDAGIAVQEMARLTRPVAIKTVRISKAGTEESDIEQAFPTAFIFLMLLYFTIILYGNQVMRGVLEEKTSRILEVLLSSTNAFQLMMGKLFGVGTVGLIQYLSWIILAWGGIFLLGNTTPTVLENIQLSPGTFFFFVLFFLIGYFQFSALYAAVGAMCSSQEDAQALSSPVTLMIVVPFIISISLGITNPDTEISRLLSLMPFFSPMMMFLRIELANPSLGEIALSMGINLLAIIVLTWLAAKIYRVGVLIYGKRPTFGEVIRWLRYS